MKSASLLLLIPLVLSQDYAVPDLDYDKTDPTCDNVDSLIASTSSDITRLKGYVSITLPKRISKLNDAYASVQKTCKIITSRRPSLIQMSSKLRSESVKSLEKLTLQVQSIANTLFEDKNNKILRNLVSMSPIVVDPKDLCSDTLESIRNLVPYLKFLMPSITNEYIEGRLAKRLSMLNSFKTECLAATCHGSDSDEDKTCDRDVQVDGYTFYPTVDSGSNDITNLAGYTVQQLADYCNSNSDCVAFNSNGWVKNKVNPTSEWYQWTEDKCLGFYTKNAPTPSGECNRDVQVAGYTFYPTVDSGSNDITNLAGYTVQQLADYCNSNSDCVAFNSNGWVKNKVNPTSEWYQWTEDKCLGFYTKNAPTPSTECNRDVQVNGYTFYPTVDSGSNDITNLAGYTPQQLADYCNSNSQCVAFNSNGWVKNKINPTNEWYQWTEDKCLGFYTKNAPAPSTECNRDVQVAGYTFYPTVDSGSNDITNLAGYTPQQLADYCNSNSQCVAFNSNGWVKNAVNPTSQWYQWTEDKCLGFYVKDAPSNVEEYVFYPTLDSNGGDITNLPGYSVDQLKAWCSANADCKGFNNNGWVKSTILPKNQWSQWTSDQSLGFYLKKSVADTLPSAPATPTYTFYQGVDSGGNDITNLGGYSVAQMKDYCNSNSQCVAFNTNGWMKYALNPTSQWYQWTSDPNQGFYVKN